MDKPWVSIVFKGGGIYTSIEPDIWIYLSRQDRHIDYIILDGARIDGNTIDTISGHLLETKVRYV